MMQAWVSSQDVRVRRAHLMASSAPTAVAPSHPRALGKFNCRREYVPSPGEFGPPHNLVRLADVAARFPLPLGDLDMVGDIPDYCQPALESFITAALACGRAQQRTIAQLSEEFRLLNIAALRGDL